MQTQQLTDYLAEASIPSVTTTGIGLTAVADCQHAIGEIAEQAALEARLLSVARTVDATGELSQTSEESMQTLNALKRITVELDSKMAELSVALHQLARTRVELAQRVALSP